MKYHTQISSWDQPVLSNKEYKCFENAKHGKNQTKHRPSNTNKKTFKYKKSVGITFWHILVCHLELKCKIPPKTRVLRRCPLRL